MRRTHPCVVDLRIDSGRSSLGTKFRKGLSQRSLAAEYNQWELDGYEFSGVDKLTRDQSLSGTRKGSQIDEPLDENKHRFHDVAATKTRIKHGIKLLTFERVWGRQGFQLSFPDTVFCDW